jgi:hypothetical protein
MKKTLVLIAVALVAVANSAFTHHSGAMFDRSRTVTLVGTMLSQMYTNPHVWISVMARPEGSNDEIARWDIETVGTGNLSRIGINKDTLKPGDKVTVKINPLRDGRRGGSLMSITTPDGVVRGFQEGQEGGVAPE